MTKSSKVKTKASAKKTPKAEKIHEPILTDASAPDANASASATTKASKNTVKLADGTEILVRGTEKTRAGYIQGNVGWQDFLRPARLALNLCTYAIKIGASDAVIASLNKEVDASLKALTDARVKIPSDMTTQKAVIDAGLTEATVGSPDYIIATRKLSGLVKFVSDAKLAKDVGAELLSAQLALKASK
jgi:hypothetical protein